MATQDSILTKSHLHELFNYCDGKLFWKKRIGKNYHLVGQEVGCNSKFARSIQVSIYKKKYYVHRIIFMMFHGYMPTEVDHIDCNPRNNKIENLREVTHSQNQHNTTIAKNNKSGVKGVYWHKESKKWMARCQAQGITHYIGIYDSLEQATNEVCNYRKNLHGEYARHV